MAEPLLEAVLGHLRLRRIVGLFGPGDRVLDVGCGFNVRALRELAPRIAAGVGIDVKEPSVPLPANVRVYKHDFLDEWNLPAQSFTKILMLASLQYVDRRHAVDFLRKLTRLLEPRGRLIVTVPLPRAKVVLDTLAFRLKLLDESLVGDQKEYYDPVLLNAMATEAGLNPIAARTFQFGMNCLWMAERP